jgi:DNA-binding PadR family transcriptional regulator
MGGITGLATYTEYAYTRYMAVREGLLALLADGPRHGYQLKTDFEAATGGVWPLNVGQVYTTLDRLERDGYVVVDLATVAPGQKQYVITPAGVDALGAWWQAVPSDEPPPRDELMLKVLMAVERGPDHALTVITRQRGVLTSLLQAKRRERRALDRDGEVAARLVTEALLARAEADLRWLDTCERTVTEQTSTEQTSTERSHS